MAFLPIGLPGRALNANVVKQSGAKLYVYAEGTTTPVTTYSDAGLTTPQAHPLVADSDGVFAAVFLADGKYKVTMTTSAGVTLPGFPIDGIGTLVDTDSFTDAVATIQTALATYADRAALAAATVPAAVKRVYLQFHTSARLYGGHRMRRINYADVSGFPAAAYTRSTDRYTTSGTTDATEGGYWIVDEESPTVSMFGGIKDGAVDEASSYAISGTDCTAAIQAWVDFYLARHAISGDRFNHGEWEFGDGVWRVTGEVNFTGIANLTRNVKISGWGATILCDGADKIIFDFTNAEYFVLEGFQAFGSTANTPVCFIKTGRPANNNTAARWAIRDCTTRWTAAGVSQFRIAALWNVASESCMTENNIWENYRTRANDTNCYAAAFDSCNWCGYEDGVAITGITQASEGVVTATAHGYSNNDKVVFGDQTGMTELEGRVYWVVDKTTNTFKLSTTDPATATTYEDTTGYTAFGSGKVHKERFASSFIGTGRATPHYRHSMKHNVHVRDTYSAPEGRAAVLQGACEDAQYVGCFGTGRFGMHFVYEDASIGFENCTFQLHFEDGGGTGLLEWGHIQYIHDSQKNVAFTNCIINECALSTENAMFRLEDGTEVVNFIGGSINITRFTAAFTGGSDRKLFSSAAQFSRYGQTISIQDTSLTGQEVDNATIRSGWLIDQSALVASPIMPTFTVATVPSAARWKHGIIHVSDETGGATMAASNGTNWRRFSDLATVS